MGLVASPLLPMLVPIMPYVPFLAGDVTICFCCRDNSPAEREAGEGITMRTFTGPQQTGMKNEFQRTSAGYF